MESDIARIKLLLWAILGLQILVVVANSAKQFVRRLGESDQRLALVCREWLEALDSGPQST